MQAWMRHGPLALLLWPLSLLFRGLVVLRRGLYALGFLRSIRLPVPVIVVGNVFVGGTGKTPLTIWLVEKLQQAGYVPGVISRGYGTRHDIPQSVTSDSSAYVVGDEPLLIARHARCPVMVGRNRALAARALLAAHPEVNLIILDDGLQHYALQRDVEIVLFDARGSGNGWMLPAGPLREPVSRRRDFTIVNAERFPSGMPNDAIHMQMVIQTAERLVDRSQRIAFSALVSSSHATVPTRIVAAAGIGNPARFFTMLRAAGLTIDEMPLPDHYDFAMNPFLGLQADMILITEKDAVKCAQSKEMNNDPRLWVVPVTTSIDDALVERIVEKCRGCPIA